MMPSSCTSRDLRAARSTRTLARPLAKAGQHRPRRELARAATCPEFAAGFSGTQRDMIHNRQDADQGNPDGTDKWRTECNFNAVKIEETAGHPLCQRSGMSGL